MRRLAALVAALALLAGPASGLAVSVGEVAEELRCVTCGTPLNVSNAPAAQQMKDRIALRIQQGASKDQIIDEFVADFGRQVLATPPKEDFDLLAWVIPGAAVLAGLIAIPFVTRAWARRRRDATPAVAAAPLSDADSARLQRELDAFREE
jgi:cytochrome c-type biogenesis protein CcmH